MDYDVIIIGGGHAGVEAALAVARMGRTAAIITMDPGKLALMSCNPAIGGVGKSHVVKEIDALGGLMGKAIDATGIQFRRLNLSRGPAVWSTRVQADRVAYNKYVVEYVKAQEKIEVIQGLAGEILTECGKATGIRTENGEVIGAQAVIVCSGTFLGGLIHIGEQTRVAGRIGELAAHKLADSIRSLGFKTGRLKTGTPPRLDGQTIDWSKCEIQPGEEPIPFFSPNSRRRRFQQTPCHLTYTTQATKELISANFERSPIFSGKVTSTGPRYCPSIEDKFFRFADKERHQLFLEPEGNGTDEVYPNGFSTSLPEDIQREAIRTVTGLESAVITQPGYAVEYDYCLTHQIKASLETRLISGLFFAGQINGTSGYEEAAGQGLMAGINAVLAIEQEPSFTLDRSEAYIGVMIDDIVTLSITEPYRLFTSRAEYRLTLREDNARDRIYRYAEKYSLVSRETLQGFQQLTVRTEAVIKRALKKRIKVSDLDGLAGRFEKIDNISLEVLLKQPGMTVAEAVGYIDQFDPESNGDQEASERAAISIRYSGYIDKQQREVDKFKRLESQVIPDDFDFALPVGLKQEAREKLARIRPGSLGQASRIEGVTPGDIAVLSVFVTRHKGNASA
ncbi:MAG: tRNA uridine-5-carboxymethylaminomethyl(34) synthesis enzyme MnmG [bacterium]|nr:tRNA uridine-5-carboxymethylaminomethyl(34) synthesis enzyme MnmG [bacterium]